MTLILRVTRSYYRDLHRKWQEVCPVINDRSGFVGGNEGEIEPWQRGEGSVGKEMPDKLGVILEKRDAILFVWDRLWSVRFEPPGGA